MAFKMKGFPKVETTAYKKSALKHTGEGVTHPGPDGHKGHMTKTIKDKPKTGDATTRAVQRKLSVSYPAGVTTDEQKELYARSAEGQAAVKQAQIRAAAAAAKGEEYHAGVEAKGEVASQKSATAGETRSTNVKAAKAATAARSAWNTMSRQERKATGYKTQAEYVASVT